MMSREEYITLFGSPPEKFFTATQLRRMRSMQPKRVEYQKCQWGITYERSYAKGER